MIDIDEIVDSTGIKLFHYVLLILCGCSFMMDAMEVNLMPFVVNCSGMTDVQKATLASSVFSGVVIGCLFWGVIGDMLGRRQTYLATACIISISGFLTAAAPNYGVMVFLRTMVGFGIGGGHVPFDLLAEFTPSSYHSTFLLNLEYFFTLGSVTVASMAWLVLARYGWQALTMLVATPIAIATIVSFAYLPESPRWLCTQKREEEALSILHAFLGMVHDETLSVPKEDDPSSRCDGLKPPIDGERTAVSSPENSPVSSRPATHSNTILEGHPRNSAEEDLGASGVRQYLHAVLFDKNTRAVTLSLWTVYTAFGFVYYGFILYITHIYSAPASSTELCSFDYGAIMLNAAAEVVGTTLAAVTVRAGNIDVQSAQTAFFVIGAVCVLLFGVLRSNDAPDSVIGAASAAVRVAIMSASSLTWVMTPALLPTAHRSFAHALCVSWSKVGALLAPYLVYQHSLSEMVVTATFAAVNIAAAVALLVLRWHLTSIQRKEQNLDTPSPQTLGEYELVAQASPFH